MPAKESIPTKADKALKSAVRKLIEARRLTNEKVVVWRNGRVEHVPARKI